MAERRLKRIGSLIKDEIGAIIQREPAAYGAGIISVTEVEVSADLQTAKVFVSVYGDENQKEKTFNAVAASGARFKKELFKKIRLRRIPDFIFVKDTSLEEGSRISSLLAKLEEEREKNGRDN